MLYRQDKLGLIIAKNVLNLDPIRTYDGIIRSH